MANGYTDTPHNMAEIMPYVLADKKDIIQQIFEKEKCYFYDTCSFRRHANLGSNEAEYFFHYITEQNGLVIITRCILMELASISGVLNTEYVNYIKHMSGFGIQVLVMYEEDVFDIMSVCFSTNEVTNEFLSWTVRSMKSPVSTITGTLEQNTKLYDEIIRGNHLDNGSIYRRFFKAVRENKESGDNLGEEVLAVCLHILSNLPGEDDGKFCVITDDKGAGGKIDTLFKNTARKHRGKRIIIFSTPKLVQVMYREKIMENREHIKSLLSTGTNGNIVVLGTRIYDLRCGEISISVDELVNLIMQPNGIHIIF